jgi:CheY-like chemotaxis protein
LPDLDGWTLVAELRRLQPGLKAVAISGHGYASDLARSSEAGFERHLTKPVQMRAVDEAIAKLFPDISEADISPAPGASENSGP